MPEPRPELPSHYLFPCTLFVHREEHLVTTILGSCVAICLQDRAMAMGGINHYMLPLWNADGLPTPKYGNIAIEKLIRKMLDQGCARERMTAKVFGGANVIGPSEGAFTVGARNIDLAWDILKEENIPVAAADVGGEFGRKIIFNTCTGVVLVSRLKRTQG